MANIQERRDKAGRLISYSIRVHRGRGVGWEAVEAVDGYVRGFAHVDGKERTKKGRGVCRDL